MLKLQLARWAVRIAGMSVCVGLGTIGHAAAPTVEVVDGHTVLGTVMLTASPEAVRAVLADTERTTRLSPDVVDAWVRPDGSCELITLRARGLFQPIDVTTRRCPSDAGWRETLVSSQVFDAWATSWTLAPSEGGTRVEFRVSTGITWPVSDAWVRARTGASVKTSLTRLAQAF